MTTRRPLVLLIIVMLIAGVWPTHVAITRAQPGRNMWEEVGGIPPTVSLADVIMLSTTSAWAVGSDHQADTSRGLVYHLTLREGRWQAAVDTTFSDEPLAISALSESNIWVVGTNGLIARKDAAGWQQVQGRASGAFLRAVAMSSNGAEGWAAGERVTSTASTGPILVRYAGGQWSTDPGITGDAGGGINGLSFAGGRGWAVGNPGIWRMGDGRWEREALPRLCEGCYTDIRDVDALSAEEAWAVGTRSPICEGCDFSLYVLHRSGGAWQPALPDTRLGNELRDTSMLHGVDFADASHGWAVGNLGNGDNRPLLLSYRDGTWAYDQAPARSGRLTAVSAADVSHALAVGDNGIVFSYGYRQPPPDERCFPETGQCISGRFRAYWERHGGLPVFGFPLAQAADEPNRDTGKVHLTQWFERNRFEQHPDTPAPYDVLLGRLGEDRLLQLNRRWQSEGREAGPRAGCLWFEQTGHNVCNQSGALGFRAYWQGHGLQDPRLNAYQRSLALFGLPLTAPRMETNLSGDTVMTQWFERARFEWHPGKPDQFKVLLGLLGVELRANRAASSAPVQGHQPP